MAIIVVNPEIVQRLVDAYNNPDFGQDDFVMVGRNLTEIYGQEATCAALDAFCAAVNHDGVN